MDNNIEKYLDICIVTYNRAEYLRKTLETFESSALKNCDIFVLDNCSTDKTPEVISSFGPSVKHIRNKYNIGANANILRAYETGDKPYVWVIGDDDEYDFTNVSDLLKILQEGNIELLHIGAHVDSEWSFGGKVYNTRDLFSKGYHFFKYSSFIGCNIVKREACIKYLVSGYNNIGNSYPHMPYLLSFFEENKQIYLSKSRICRAVIGNQGYNREQFLVWWAKTCKILKNRDDQKKCFFDQFQKETLRSAISMRSELIISRSKFEKETQKTVMDHFSYTNKSLSLLLLPLRFIYKNFKSLITRRTRKSVSVQPQID